MKKAISIFLMTLTFTSPMTVHAAEESCSQDFCDTWGQFTSVEEATAIYCNSTNPDYDQCVSDVQMNFAAKESYCAAAAITGGAQAKQGIMAGLYTIVAAACLAVCVAEKTGIGSASKPVCAFGALGVSAADIAFDLLLKDNMSTWTSGWQTAGDTAGQLGGLVSSGFAIYQGLNSAGTTAATTTTTTTTTAVGETTSVTTTTASNTSKASNAASCLTSAIDGIIAGLKFASLIDMSIQKDKACTELAKMNGTMEPQVGTTTVANVATDLSLGTTDSANADGTTAATTVSPSSGSDLVSQAISDPNIAAARASPYGKYLPKNEEIKKIPDYLKQMGIDPSKLMQDAMAGNSGGLKSAFDSISPGSSIIVTSGEQLLRDKYLNNKNGMYASKGGGSGKGKDKANPFSLMNFGAGAGGPNAGKKELRFDATKGRSLAGICGTSEFHEGCHLSIFELVSAKLVLVKDRIADLPWSSPVNRALANVGVTSTSPVTNGTKPSKNEVNPALLKADQRKSNAKH